MRAKRAISRPQMTRAIARHAQIPSPFGSGQALRSARNASLRMTSADSDSWDVPARCVKPPGRSLEPRSNARPRGMAVPSRLAGTDRIRLTGPAATHLIGAGVPRSARDFGGGLPLEIPRSKRSGFRPRGSDAPRNGSTYRSGCTTLLRPFESLRSLRILAARSRALCWSASADSGQTF